MSRLKFVIESPGIIALCSSFFFFFFFFFLHFASIWSKSTQNVERCLEQNAEKSKYYTILKYQFCYANFIKEKSLNSAFIRL